VIKIFRIFLVIPMLFVSTAISWSEKRIFFREDFNNLHNWRPLYFPKIKRHSLYTITGEGNNRFLRAVSSSSASGLIFKREYNIYKFPYIEWRWKVDNVYKKGDASSKAGDDYPIRVYVLFKYDPEKSSLAERLRYNSARRIYGQYPPHSSLNYIWANKDHDEYIITNPYSEKTRMVLLQMGTSRVGKWMTERVHVLSDYRRAFGENPPPRASLAIMNDSDNTGEKSLSYIDYLIIY
jgi:hypothetical protein